VVNDTVGDGDDDEFDDNQTGGAKHQSS